MKKIIELNDSWQLKDSVPFDKISSEQFQYFEKFDSEPSTSTTQWFTTHIPAQVHDVLLKEGIIEDPSLLGKQSECLWVAEKDWIYKCAFNYSDEGKRAFLHFKGLDTLVDIYLNRKHIAYHNDMYLPERVEVTGVLEEENILILHFHSPHEFIKHNKLPEEWQKTIRPFRVIRKCDMDFTDYLGPKPYFTRMGVYDKIQLEIIDEMEILESDISTRLIENYSQGKISLKVNGSGYNKDAVLKVEIKGPNKEAIAEDTFSIIGNPKDGWEQACEMTVNHPELWWPRGYGEHPLYEVIVTVLVDGDAKDRNTKSIGFREIKMVKPFDFIVNGRQIKLWGAQPAQINGMTHCWDNEKSNRILDLVENCNMNAQQIWGGADRHDDEYYNETDRRGILVWQEFFHNYGMYPTHKEFRDLCKQEVEFQVRRLKHHPSLLFWCGGNESFMGAEYVHPGVPYIGGEIFLEDYQEICDRLDPDRYYHPNSPYGGEFTNDPLHGDTHSYTNTWYVPGADYPIMVAEEIRPSPPAVKSMIKYLGKEKAWPAHYTGLITKESQYPWPDTWTERSSTQGWIKIPPIELFYDSDSLESAVYKFGAAHGYYMKKILENNRRGKPSEQPEGERINKGHFVCRWSDSWPIIYGSMLDYYLEPYIPYYAVKRSYEPVLISFDVQNFIYAWMVNDSAKAVKGTLHMYLFDQEKNEFVNELIQEVEVESGESKLITDLNQFQQFSRQHVLYAHLVDENGKIISRANEFVDIEKHIRFPDAKISMEISGDTITLTTDKFARCVELTGNNDGEEFGWVFEDNYFDLLPNEVKTVKILGRHKKGMISAKPYYSKFTSKASK